jgi:hypothetical protein
VDVPQPDWAGLATAAGLEAGAAFSTVTSRTTNAVPLTNQLAAKLGDAVLKSGIRLANKGQRSEWQVPTGLTDTSEEAATSR